MFTGQDTNMNDYLVCVYISAKENDDDPVSATVTIEEVPNKDIAIEKALKHFSDKGFFTYGTDYCDLL